MTVFVLILLCMAVYLGWWLRKNYKDELPVRDMGKIYKDYVALSPHTDRGPTQYVSPQCWECGQEVTVPIKVISNLSKRTIRVETDMVDWEAHLSTKHGVNK